MGANAGRLRRWGNGIIWQRSAKASGAVPKPLARACQALLFASNHTPTVKLCPAYSLGRGDEARIEGPSSGRIIVYPYSSTKLQDLRQ